MTTVTPFPWESLKEFRPDDVVLRNKLVSVYECLQSQTDFLKTIFGQGLSLLTQTEVQFDLSAVNSGTVGQMIKGVSADSLMGVVLLEPLGKKAVVTFEASLTKLLVQRVLAGESFQPQNFFKSELRPVTPLEEAVLQYALVTFLDQLVVSLQPKDFKPLLDGVFENTAKFASVFLAQDILACFSLRARLFEHDFFIKVYLPLETSYDLIVPKNMPSLLGDQLRQMGRLSTQMQLEVASVTLAADDMAKLGEGDILIFDETLASYHSGQLEGLGSLVFADTQESHGYTVEVQQSPSGFSAKLLGVL